MPTIRLVASLGFSGADRIDEVETPHDWDSMTEAERDNWANEALEDHLANVSDSYWEFVEEGE